MFEMLSGQKYNITQYYTSPFTILHREFAELPAGISHDVGRCGIFCVRIEFGEKNCQRILMALEGKQHLIGPQLSSTRPVGLKRHSRMCLSICPSIIISYCIFNFLHLYPIQRAGYVRCLAGLYPLAITIIDVPWLSYVILRDGLLEY